MRQRPSSRLLVLDAADRVLLFRFEHNEGALAGQAFWATPGGGLNTDESFERAAVRELHEETGLVVEAVGPSIARRVVTFTLPSGELVEADERYFIVRAGHQFVSYANQTHMERDVMAAHRWWAQAEITVTADQVWPENLSEMLIDAGVWTAAP